ncbi:MAG: hypothetical protein ACC683_10370 [Acidimicrobiia bacterium]
MLRLARRTRANIEQELWATAYPPGQSLLLAARATGLGAALIMPSVVAPKGTYERIIGLPKGVLLAAVIPVGYPKGRYGPVTRPPARAFISWDHFRAPAGRKV